MRVTVRLLASAKDKAGVGQLSLDLPPSADVAAAATLLAQHLPAISPQLDRVAYAINCEYVSPDTMLKDGDELAIIPPVSGG